MSKRARYDGPFAEVRVTWPPGAAYPENEWLVKQGHQLPAEAPAALRDELVKGDDWSEVDQATPTGKKDGGDK
jgi:hypothetical protein